MKYDSILHGHVCIMKFRQQHTGDGVDFTSFFFVSTVLSGFTAESELDGLTVEEVAGLFFSSTAEVEGEGLESSASLDAALTAAAPADIKVNNLLYESNREKSCLWGSRPGPTQTRLYNHD